MAGYSQNSYFKALVHKTGWVTCALYVIYSRGHGIPPVNLKNHHIEDFFLNYWTTNSRITFGLCLYPGVQSSIPGSPSLPDETLSCGPIFWKALKPEPLPVEPSGAPDHKTTKNINSPGPVLVPGKEQPQMLTLTTFYARLTDVWSDLIVRVCTVLRACALCGMNNKQDKLLQFWLVTIHTSWESFLQNCSMLVEFPVC